MRGGLILNLTEARRGLDAIKDQLISKKINSETYWISSKINSKKNLPIINLIPAFDELVISYKDRNAVIIKEKQKKVFSLNGIFYPVVTFNGQVIGFWKRKKQNKTVEISFDFFAELNKKHIPLIESAIKSYEKF